MKKLVKAFFIVAVCLCTLSCSDLFLETVVDAGAPEIVTQPIDVTTNEIDGFTLTVHAVSPDGGQLSYQWFKSGSKKMKDAVLVGSSASLTVNAADHGVFYYFCRVTNTNESRQISGNCVATADTAVVKVTVEYGDYTYTVEHYQQNIADDGYTLVTEDSGIRYGHKNTSTAAVAKTYEGFTARNIDQKTIKEDCSTLVKVYYDRNNYTINFDTDGGSNIASVTGRYGAPVTVPANPERRGYTFTQWDVDIPAVFPVGDITCTAEWQANQYTITYITDEDTRLTATPTIHTFGTTTILPEPHKGKLIFDGWYTTSDYTGDGLTKLGATDFAEDITLYANWGYYKLQGSSTQKQGDVAKAGLTINGTEIAKTSEIVVIPQGMQAAMYFPDNSSWENFIPKSGYNSQYMGVYIKDTRIKLSSFVIGQFPVTRDLYKAVMGIDPSTAASTGAEGENPVNNVNWFDAIIFCNKLSILEGLEPVYSYNFNGTDETDPDKWIEDTVHLGPVPSSEKRNNYNNWCDGLKIDISKNGYRLPTDAEWEYAARGGDPTKSEWLYAFSGIQSASTNVPAKSTDENLILVSNGLCGRTSAVGSYEPNSLMLYDMSGNVWEYCNDYWNGISSAYRYPLSSDGFAVNPLLTASSTQRSQRGGSFDYAACCSTVTHLGYMPPYEPRRDNGFRLVRSLPDD